MSTSKEQIRQWLLEAKTKGATHMLVVCGTYDHEDYPSFVMTGTDPKKVFDDYNNASMQRVMEVYNLSMDVEKQLAEHRAYNF